MGFMGMSGQTLREFHLAHPAFVTQYLNAVSQHSVQRLQQYGSFRWKTCPLGPIRANRAWQVHVLGSQRADAPWCLSGACDGRQMANETEQEIWNLIKSDMLMAQVGTMTVHTPLYPYDIGCP